FELKNSDFEASIKSIPPGEWLIMDGGNNELWFGFINPQIDEKFVCAYVLNKVQGAEIKDLSPEEIIKNKIDEAISKRLRISGYEKNSRIFFGVNDGIPGLIVDQFEN